MFIAPQRSDLASKISSKLVMQAASSIVVLGIGIGDLVIFVAFTLLILLPVASKPFDGNTQKFDFSKSLFLFTFKSTPVFSKELLWLWRTHERQKQV